MTRRIAFLVAILITSEYCKASTATLYLSRSGASGACLIRALVSEAVLSLASRPVVRDDRKPGAGNTKALVADLPVG